MVLCSAENAGLTLGRVILLLHYNLWNERRTADVERMDQPNLTNTIIVALSVCVCDVTFFLNFGKFGSHMTNSDPMEAQ